MTPLLAHPPRLQHFGSKYPGQLVLLSQVSAAQEGVSDHPPSYCIARVQVVNLVVMGDYVYYYLASARSGRPVLLPTSL